MLVQRWRGWDLNDAGTCVNGTCVNGTCVRLHSLRQRDDLNGMAGVILGSQGERYGVRVAGSTLAVKAANLTLVLREERVAQETVLEGEVYLEILAALLLQSEAWCSSVSILSSRRLRKG